MSADATYLHEPTPDAPQAETVEFAVAVHRHVESESSAKTVVGQVELATERVSYFSVKRERERSPWPG